jgi:hypothetical protein
MHPSGNRINSDPTSPAAHVVALSNVGLPGTGIVGLVGWIFVLMANEVWIIVTAFLLSALGVGVYAARERLQDSYVTRTRI